MKRIALLILILCVFLVSPARSQLSRGGPHFSQHSILRHRIGNGLSKTLRAIQSRSLLSPALAVKSPRVWDLGAGPDGLAAEAGGVNDFGAMVAVANAADGDTHLYRIDLLAPNAPWTDMGGLGAYEGWFTWPLITDTGLVIGYAASKDADPATGTAYVHGFVWAGNSGKTDLGALPQHGRNNSVAQAANKLGTLIAGYVWGDSAAQMYPVAWKPSTDWKIGGPVAIWKTQPLPTTDEFPYGFVLGINCLGQMAGAIYNDDGVYVAALWNPASSGKGWKLIQLPRSKGWSAAIAGDINEKGEVVGDVLSLDWSHGYASIWQPVDAKRQTYKLTLLPNVSGLPNGDTAEGINDLGDIVGASWDETANMVAVRWSTKDLNSVQPLSFPGDWGLAFRVNDFRIATGTYGGGTCPVECVAAVQFH